MADVSGVIEVECCAVCGERERERERERRLRKGFRDRTRERSPITDEYGIISDPSMDHHDSDVPSDNGSHFLGDIE